VSADLEFRILALEKEAAHLREMHDLAHRRLDIGDNRQTLTENLLRENSRQLADLTGKVDTLVGKLDALVSALLREHPNGHEGNSK
jgi:uncharacterized coiled-coil protein SlyX